MISVNKRFLVYRNDGFRCARCKTKENLTIDHVVPIGMGGSKTDRNNLQTLCDYCNQQKGMTIACYTGNRHVRNYVRTFIKYMRKQNEVKKIER